MKKKNDFFDKQLEEIIEVSHMLDEKGQGDGKGRAYQVAMELLLFCELHLTYIRRVLFILLGLEIGKFISGLF